MYAVSNKEPHTDNAYTLRQMRRRINSVSNFEDLDAVFHAVKRQFGADYYGYLVMAPHSQQSGPLHHQSDLPNEVVQFYVKQELFYQDSLASNCIAQFEPVTLCNIKDNLEAPMALRRLYKHAYGLGLRNGLYVPVMGGAGNTYGFMALLSCSDGVGVRRSLEYSAPEAFWLGQMIHRQTTGLLQEQGRLLIPTLSSKEKRILYWVCEGLTSKQIAGKMGYNAHTSVDYHINTLSKKLGCDTRAQISARAMALGLVSPIRDAV